MFDLCMLIAGLTCLYLGSEWLLRGALAVSQRYQLAPVATGMVLLGLGTSAPELAVSLDAALSHHGDMAVGNIVGSNIVNFALVLGLAATARRIPTMAGTALADILSLGALTALMLAFMHDQHLSRLEGTVLFLGVAYALWSAVRRPRQTGESAGEPDVTGSTEAAVKSQDAGTADIWRQIGLLATGITVLVIGAELAVTGGIGLARTLNIEEATIALTVTAVGTGLPEIAATLAAMARGQTGLALGNVIGSNLVNIGLVLGVSALAVPLDAPGVGLGPMAALAALTALVLGIMALCRYVQRWMGFALLSAFGAYQVALFA